MADLTMVKTRGKTSKSCSREKKSGKTSYAGDWWRSYHRDPELKKEGQEYAQVVESYGYGVEAKFMDGSQFFFRFGRKTDEDDCRYVCRGDIIVVEWKDRDEAEMIRSYSREEAMKLKKLGALDDVDGNGFRLVARRPWWFYPVPVPVPEE